MSNEIAAMLNELQKLISTTKQRGNKMRKLVIRSLTDIEEQRAELKAFIEASKFNNNRAGLAEKLAKLNPFDNWNKRKLDSWLTNAKYIPSTQLNQMLDFIEPDEKVDLSFGTLQQGLDACRIKINELETALYNSRKTENKIDDKEFNLIQSYGNLIINSIQKFMSNTQMVVNQPLA